MIHHSEASASSKGARGLAMVLAVVAASFSTAASAADVAGGPEPEAFGVPCSIGAPPWSPPVTAATLPWRSVWLGRFAGGRPDPIVYGLIDWRDEQICFPSRAACRTWVNELRRAYHRPEGYWTCLLLR